MAAPGPSAWRELRQAASALRAYAREVRAVTRNQRHVAVLRRALREKTIKK